MDDKAPAPDKESNCLVQRGLARTLARGKAQIPKRLHHLQLCRFSKAPATGALVHFPLIHFPKYHHPIQVENFGGKKTQEVIYVISDTLHPVVDDRTDAMGTGTREDEQQLHRPGRNKATRVQPLVPFHWLLVLKRRRCSQWWLMFPLQMTHF